MAPGVLPVPLGSGDEALYPEENVTELPGQEEPCNGDAQS